MQIIIKTAHHTWRWTLRFFITLLLAFALLLAALRLLLPLAGDYRSGLEQRISAHIGLPVQIEQLHIAWWGWGPALQIDGFSLLDPDDESIRFGFRNALISLDMARSLWSGQLMLHHASLQGGQLLMQWSTESGLQFLPNQSNTSNPATLQDVVSWLFQTEALDLRFEQLIINPAKPESTVTPATYSEPLFLADELLISVRGDEKSRRLDVSLALPDTSGKQLQIAAQLNGHPDTPEQWQADFYLRSDPLALSRQIFTDLALDADKAELELWAYWRNNTMQEILGKIHFDQLSFAAENPIDDADLHLQWRPDEQGWQVNSQLSAYFPDLAEKLSSQITLSQRQSGQQTWLEGKTSALALPLLTHFAASLLPPAQQQLLQGLAPSGTLAELSFRLPRDSGQWQFSEWQLKARLDNLQLQPWQKIPGISALQGNLTLSRDNGWLALDAQQPDLDWKLLRQSVKLDHFSGILEWQRRQHDQGWSLWSNNLKLANADLDLQARGQIILAPESSPVLDLQVDYADIDIAKVRDYLPAAIIKPKLLNWLDHAFVSGRIPFGGLVFLGALADFPFENAQGLFETRFLTENMVFNYHPQWPDIEQLDAEVIFRNRNFAANAKNGQIFDVDLGEVQASIERMGKSPLQLHGLLNGPGQSMLNFVQESPLQKTLGKHLKGIEITQNNDLDLNLTIPLKKDEETGEKKKAQVTGLLSFSGNRVTIAEHNVDLSDVQGQLKFTERDLNAEQLKLKFRGDPARLNIATVKAGTGREALQFQLQGQLGLNALLDKQAVLFEPHFSGRSDWNVVLTIPKKPLHDASRFSIDFQSDLAGMKVDLPKPLAKPAADKRTLKGRAEIGTGMRLSLDYAPDAQALIQLIRENGKLQFHRGELRINSGAPELPVEPGLNTIARLREFDLSALGAGSEALPDWFTHLQADIDELTIGEQRLRNTAVRLTQQNQELHLQLQGNDVSGQIIVPASLSSQRPIRAQLQRVLLSSDDKADAQADNKDGKTLPEPDRIPPLQLVIDDLQLDGVSLGHLALLITPDQRGLNLEQLELQSEQHQLSATGEWRILAEGQQQSRLQAHFYSQALGDTLTSLGYQDVDLKGAEILADLAASWSGSLLSFSPQSMRGLLRLQIGKGQFMALDPGLGRFVGLFNIGTLTRRLSLDFSDLFESGLAFDDIAGQVYFDSGKAATDDLLLKGPSANILFDGSLDLVNQQFDQTITVMPQLGSSLAIAGALTGGPAVGAAVLLAGQLFKSGLDKVIAYQYSLNGSWDDPQIEIIKQPRSLEESGFGQR